MSEEVIPIVLKNGIRFIVFNLDNLKDLDNKGIDSLIELQLLARRNNGRISICGASRDIKNKIKDILPVTSNNELKALEYFRV